MISNLVDSLVSIFSPVAGLKRVAARKGLEQIRRSYEGGRIDRTTKPWRVNPESGESPNIGEIQRIRMRAWDLYRNNVYARKIVRAIIAQSIGCGLKPESQASNSSGDPDDKFRKRANDLWSLWCANPSRVGRPGQGGLTFQQISAMAFRELILSGEIFVHVIKEDSDSGKPIPFSIELISSERVPDEAVMPGVNNRMENGNYFWRGIEFDKDGKRVNYYVYETHPQDPRPSGFHLKTKPIPANEIIHLFQQERPDQVRGVSWFAPVILHLRDVCDYQENELIAATVAACVTLVVQRNPGAPAFGLQGSGDQTDKDGNSITRMQPGSIFRLNQGETAQGFNPNRPNGNAEDFINHLLRGAASAMPGLKASTVHGDYRDSSFSSEKTAENDCWREIEQVQEMLADGLSQPIWERVIESGVENGWFDSLDFRSFKPSQFGETKSRYLAASWNGPVAKSINPTDDETASELAIKTGTSSLPIECAARGLSWEQVLEDQARVAEKRKALGLPDPAQLEADALKAKANPKPSSKGPNGEDASSPRFLARGA